MKDLYCLICGFELVETADHAHYCGNCDLVYSTDETSDLIVVEIQK